MSDHYDSRPDTRKHIADVQLLLSAVIRELNIRLERHDRSKLHTPELSTFDELTPLLKETTYDSDEYKALLKRMGPALEHHYAHNDHHPEHFPPDETHEVEIDLELRFHPSGDEYTLAIATCVSCDWSTAGDEGDVRGAANTHVVENFKRGGIYAMDLIQLTEMLCDWKAATLRHDDGDLAKSIEHNAMRFGYGDDMKELLERTARNMGWL